MPIRHLKQPGRAALPALRLYRVLMTPTGTEEETADRFCTVEGSMKMQRIGKQLREQQAEAVKLDDAIVANLMGLGYGG